MNEVLIQYFDNLYRNDRMNHAFLICNSSYEDLRNDLIYILSKYFFEKDIDIDNYPDIFIIKPSNNKIAKDDILLLQDNLKTTSQVNKNRVYIIDGVEKMNEYASNSLLKFLEEPESGIFAFLISSNINKVLPTIKSRCQVLMINSNCSFAINKYDVDIIDKSIKFVNCLENNGTKSIAFMMNFMNKKEEKENIRCMVEIIKYFYLDCLYNLFSKDVCYFNNYMSQIDFVCSKNNVKTIIYKLIVLNKNENMLEYNLNTSLFLDNLIIEMEDN